MSNKLRYFNELFAKFSKLSAFALGSSWCFSIALMIIMVWLLVGPVFGFSDTWQLVINSFTSIVTFLMVFIIQNTQNRDTQIIKLKIDELIKTINKANNQMLNLDESSEEELKKIQDHNKQLSRKKT